jgi:uncharacterized cupin superfamily protein
MGSPKDFQRVEVEDSDMTNSTKSLNPTDVYVLNRDEGQHLHFLDNLATVKVSAGTDGSISAVEFLAPRGFGPPMHCHLEEDEIVYVLEGEVAFRTHDHEVVASTGGLANLPHGVPHTFQVLSDSARMLSITASATGAPRFDQMVTALGTPTEVLAIPDPMVIDPGEVAHVNASFGIEVLGPPPAPLAI